MVLIPRSSGRNMPRPTLQQHTPITGLGSIGKAVDDVLEARKEEKDKKEKADFALQSSKIGADINVVDSDLTLKIQTGELPYEEAVKQRQQSLESIKTQYKNVVPKQFEQNFNNYFEQHSYQSASKYLPIAQKSEQQQAIVQLKGMRENYLKNPNASEKEVWNGLSLYAQSKGLPLAHVQDTFNEYKNNRASNDVTTFYQANKSDNEKLTELSTPEAVIAKHPDLTQEQAVY